MFLTENCLNPGVRYLAWKRSSGWLESWEVTLKIASARVANNSPSQDSSHPDDLFLARYECSWVLTYLTVLRVRIFVKISVDWRILLRRICWPLFTALLKQAWNSTACLVSCVLCLVSCVHLKLINNSWREKSEITTVKKVWICDPNYHKIWWTFLLLISLRIIDALRSYIKLSKECFIRYPNTSKLVKKTRLRLVFSSHFLEAVGHARHGVRHKVIVQTTEINGNNLFLTFGREIWI